MSNSKDQDAAGRKVGNPESIDKYFSVIRQSRLNPEINASSTSLNATRPVITPGKLVSPKDLYDSLSSYEKNNDLKSTLEIFAKAYEGIYNKQDQINTQLDEMSVSSDQLEEHVNAQITKLEDDLAMHKNVTEDKLLSLKVTADIRHSKHFLKIFIKNENRIKNINKLNARNEARKIFNELQLDLGNVVIVNAETRYEKRKLFGPLKFIKFIMVTFNDFVSAERLLLDFLKSNKADKGESSSSVATGMLFNNNYYLELPSTYEMRKVMSVCRELKSDEQVANAFYGSDSIRVYMKKDDPNDVDEIPKRFDVTNLHDVDRMRKKFVMKNADIPAKQLFNRDYWAKKKEKNNNINSVANNENAQQAKRRLEKSFEGITANKNAKKGKKSKNNSSTANNMSIDEVRSPNDNSTDRNQ